MHLTRLMCWLQLLTQSQRALSNIHTHLSSLERNALTQFPKAEVCSRSLRKKTKKQIFRHLHGDSSKVQLSFTAEITQGGSADTQLHRGQLSSAGGATELPRPEQGNCRCKRVKTVAVLKSVFILIDVFINFPFRTTLTLWKAFAMTGWRDCSTSPSTLSSLLWPSLPSSALCPVPGGASPGERGGVYVWCTDRGSTNTVTILKQICQVPVF